MRFERTFSSLPSVAEMEKKKRKAPDKRDENLPLGFLSLSDMRVLF